MSDFTNTTFRDYMRILFRQKAVVIVTFITVMVTVALGLMLKTPVYEAHVKMLVSATKQIDDPYYKDLIDTQNIGAIATQSEIVKSDPILDRTVRALGLYDMPFDYENRFCSPLKSFFVKLRVKMLNAKLGRLKPKEQQGYRYRMALDHLRESILIEPIQGTSLFDIKVRDFNGYGAAVLANVVSRSYVIFDLEQQVAELQLKYGDKNLAVTQFKDNIAKMEKSLNGEPVSNIEAIGPASVKIIEQAQIPIQPTGVPKNITMFLALFMSIFLSVLFAFVFEYMDPTFKSPQSIEDELDLPFLRSIPRRKLSEKLLIQLDKIRSRYTHFYQILSVQLYLLMKDKHLKSILVTAAGAHEGTTTIVANLGLFLSGSANHKVLLLDANFRSPSLHKLFKIENTIGFADLIEGKVMLKDVTKEVGKNLHLVTAGQTELNPMILINSSMVRELIEESKKKFEIILIDCPNIMAYKESIALAEHTDATVLIVSEGVTRRHVVKIALQPLFAKKVNLLGVVLNNRSFPIPKFVYEKV